MLLRKLLYAAFSNAPGQRLLRANVYVSELLMGIGSAADPASSGERALLKRLAGAESGGCVVVDVGANQGQFVQQVLDAFAQRSVRIHAFEPSGQTFQVLRDRLGSSPGVRLNRLALGREAGTATLYSDAPGSGLASMTRRRLDHFGIQQSRTEEITVGTLDNYLQAQGLGDVALLKLDVEGNELDVLKGGLQSLRTGIVRRVLFEFGGCNIDSRTYLQDFFYLFHDLGMHLFRLTPGGYLQAIARYEELLEKFRTTMFLAVRPEMHL